MSLFPHRSVSVDFCVVGGGLAGVCAAVAAARHGLRVALVQDRPVLGGNASSEIRMWICGAHGAENRESGLLEELMLRNAWRNPGLKYTLWDSVLYGLVAEEESCELLLNTTCLDAETAGDRIAAIDCWQLTTQTRIRVEAALFADCSGDGILRVSGAAWRWGREARDEFDERCAPERADGLTMGHSLLLQLRRCDRHRPFVPPAWAHRYREEDLPNRPLAPTGHNFWWLEIGGDVADNLAGTEKLRDELYRIAFGVWDLIKNHPDGRGHGWELEWIGSLPGKRENVRYEGDHILTQNDVEAGGAFPDLVAYGGWTMDDHNPGGIRSPKPPTVHHPAPSPFGLPWRCLYSRNVTNLLFAGRDISATHMAMSATRVMATCALMGQAVGTGAALAVRERVDPRGVGERHINELQRLLQDDDCWLPGLVRPIPAVSRDVDLTASRGDPEPLRDGVERELGGEAHAWTGAAGDWFEYRLPAAIALSRLRLIVDSELGRERRMPCSWPPESGRGELPDRLPRDLEVAVELADGTCRSVAEIRDNHRRLLTIPLLVEARAVRVTLGRAWGGSGTEMRVFAADVE